MLFFFKSEDDVEITVEKKFYEKNPLRKKVIRG